MAFQDCSLSSGRVFFVGAGPGDPELLTLKAQRLIAQADLILYAGSLVNPEVLRHAREGVAAHTAALTLSSAGMQLEEQVALMRDAVQKGQTVVRLHTGDPSIYGAIMEQMRELDRAGIAYSVVPGVSSAFAATAALGIELTTPGPDGTQTVILSRLSGRTPVPEREALRELAAHRASLVLFLSVGMIDRVVGELRTAGYDEATPIAIVYRASWPDELVVRGTLADIAGKVAAAEITHQAVIVVSPALEGPASVRCSHLYGTAQDTPLRQDSTAIVTLTRGGAQTGRRLKQGMPDSVLYLPARFAQEKDEPQPGVELYTVSIRQVLQSAFKEFASLVCVMATGIVVRELAPVLGSKHTDPGVVVLDEGGQYAISLLSGHKGGANGLAQRVADLLGGHAVLTTSSDVQGLPAVDLLGQEESWVIRYKSHLTAVSAALVNGEPVGVYQDAGGEGWWPDPLPEQLVRYDSFDALTQASPAAAIVISGQQPPAVLFEAVPHTIVYHPRCLAVGVGCNRGTPADEIVEAILDTLDGCHLARESVWSVATIEHKADEPGLLEACQLQGWPLRVFSREEISRVENLPTPSPAAYRALGVRGVAEPAAMLAAGTDTFASLPGPGARTGSAGRLLIEKRKYANVTVAVARRGGG
jgi:precorrin-4 C11-methyltransferase